MRIITKSFPYIFAYLLLSFAISFQTFANSGYDLWLQYKLIENEEVRNNYKVLIDDINLSGDSPTMSIIRKELSKGLGGLLGESPTFSDSDANEASLIIGTPANAPFIAGLNLALEEMGEEGYLIQRHDAGGVQHLIIAANTDIGLLYGTFHLLRILQTNESFENLEISSSPKIQRRILNHWDNLDRTVERGYSGFSIWNWHRLPNYIDQQYIDYARANASIGINGTVLTNVNANALVLTEEYIEKVAAMADAFRPYGLKIYLTARFSAPIEIGGLETADPLNEEVREWWKAKTDEIYEKIPDFGGFLVKADSEGQPGPHNYKRTQAEGANMLAEAVAPHEGIIMWRAFVYSEETPDDRAKQAYNEFVPLDGKFNDNVIVQVKNGAIDFQPREPFHPMFGAMPNSPLMMEFQLTQEYLGHDTHLAYLSPMYKEVLDTDTYAQGEGSTVAKVVDGSLDGHPISAIAGVANIGSDRNWTGHHFAQSNWYAYGRLAWNHELNSEEIADEWLKMTFSTEDAFVETASELMLQSHETIVNYMTPLGLHHIMAWSHHYGPGPWIKDKHRDDWTSVYYHQAGEDGIGFDRTAEGSDALGQYHTPIEDKWGDIDQIPEKYLLWFHHVNWDHPMESGNTLWEELVHRYYDGAEAVGHMRKEWDKLEAYVDEERFDHIQQFLKIQEKEAKWWRNACVLYFQQHADRPLPEGLEKPDKSLEYYMSMDPKFVPGI